ncbi:SRPBCC domain-containing protein [Pedobacter aquatilis]|uniref:SRPBCC family protein n=1 Tax=Pedobacter aquatilis TaxID=351343 RepID=UPI002930A46E|nr:SRPBCC domain-containing protein [Pedobacter aquatilis]
MSLKFEFTVDKENNTVHVQREFAADLATVWKAWTTAEILDQWWAPKPYRAETKSLDFKEGGTWFYAMVSPENEKHWCKANYEHISDKRSYSYKDAFCDEDGNLNNQFPSSHWTNTFTTSGNNTLVDIVIKHQHANDLAQILEMGFKEGFTMGLSNLDEVLAKK